MNGLQKKTNDSMQSVSKKRRKRMICATRKPSEDREMDLEVLMMIIGIVRHDVTGAAATVEKSRQCPPRSLVAA